MSPLQTPFVVSSQEEGDAVVRALPEGSHWERRSIMTIFNIVDNDPRWEQLRSISNRSYLALLRQMTQDPSKVGDEELLHLRGIGRKNLAKIREVFPYQPEICSDEKQLLVERVIEGDIVLIERAENRDAIIDLLRVGVRYREDNFTLVFFLVIPLDEGRSFRIGQRLHIVVQVKEKLKEV